MVREPVEVDMDQIETLVENEQRYTIWEITDILKISKPINEKFIGENEKYVFYFMEKSHMDFLANPIISASHQRKWKTQTGRIQ